MRRLSLDEIKDRISKLHGTQVVIDDSSYCGLRKPCRFIDSDYGDWVTDPWGVLTGRGHPKRGRASMGTKQTVTRDDMIQRLKETCGDNVTLGNDYQGLSRKCTFIDKDYGEWKQLPQRVLKGFVHPKRRAEKARLTCLARYGVTHTNHLADVWSKIAKGRPRWSKERHWKTGDSLICMSSYEVAFVKWCAKNQIDFEWQIKHDMPDGRAYIVDAHILDGQYADTWIEIKGWMRDEGKRKWEWFHSTHPNSELWTQDRLRKLEILA